MFIFIAFILFFYVHFFWSQKIYSRNYFFIFLIISLIIPFVSFVKMTEKDQWFKEMTLTLISLFHLILLLIVKIFYKLINDFLVRKNLLKRIYLGKQFTYVQWDSEVTEIEDWWDNQIATKPSWLDYFITYCLLFFPLLIAVVLKKWIL